MIIYYGYILTNTNRRKIQFNDKIHTNISFYLAGQIICISVFQVTSPAPGAHSI